MEEWAEIKDYPSYMISSFGRVKGISKILNPYISVRGYYVVNLYKDKKPKTVYVHRLIGDAFISNPENKYSINHKDGNKINNNLSNLEWATHAEQLFSDYNGKRRRSGFEGLFGSKNHKSRAVSQYSLSGEFIKEYESAHMAEREGGFLNKCINACLRGRARSHANFIWKYA